MQALLPYSFARDFGFAVQPVGMGEPGEPAESGQTGENDAVTLFMADHATLAMLPEVRRSIGPIAAVKKLSRTEFEKLLSSFYATRGLDAQAEDDLTRGDDSLTDALEGAEQSADLLAGDDDAPVIRLLNSLFSEALQRGASDIHLEPFEDKVSVRIRVDGVMTKLIDLSARLAPYMVSRVKVMGRLDIAEKRVPQDGRFSLSLGGRAFDVRLSTLPIRYGERVVMRLLDAAKARIQLSDLGMDTVTNGRFLSALDEPNGIILVTGPTGSGKTTTLYAALGLLNDQSRNIMTVEDPVEYALDGVSQTQVNSKVGMTFASGLRSILRQDPDVVMVGEIRDGETAEMAVQASMTGHLVLSTVHTNNAIAALARLTDMGVEQFLLASTVKAILAQRLVRILCPSCKEACPITPEEKALLGPKTGETTVTHLYHPTGCPDCGGTGYKGRRGIYELVLVDDRLSRMIQSGASEQDMADYAFKKADTLSASGAGLVAGGQTTLEEVMRVSKLTADALETDHASV